MSDDLVKRLRNPVFGTETTERNLMSSAADRIEELEAKLAKAVEIGNRMAASIEGNYYIPGVAGEWRKLTGDTND